MSFQERFTVQVALIYMHYNSYLGTGLTVVALLQNLLRGLTAMRAFRARGKP
jgi:hypothetical protein